MMERYLNKPSRDWHRNQTRAKIRKSLAAVSATVDTAIADLNLKVSLDTVTKYDLRDFGQLTEFSKLLSQLSTEVDDLMAGHTSGYNLEGIPT